MGSSKWKDHRNPSHQKKKPSCGTFLGNVPLIMFGQENYVIFQRARDHLQNSLNGRSENELFVHRSLPLGLWAPVFTPVHCRDLSFESVACDDDYPYRPLALLNIVFFKLVPPASRRSDAM